MKHTNGKFYESVDTNDIKVCNMKLKVDEMPIIVGEYCCSDQAALVEPLECTNTMIINESKYCIIYINIYHTNYM